MAIRVSPNLRRQMNRLKTNKNAILCIVIIIGFIFLFFIWKQKGETQLSDDIVSIPGLRKSPKKNLSPCVTFNGRNFLVKGKKMKILSGAIHYFRVVPDYWYDRLKKLKAMGLNTVETYVAWNMHEPLPGKFDFTGILDIRQFIHLAQELDLNVIVRPGPYICAEWDNGGLPAWLLNDPNMRVRTTYDPYLKAVNRFFVELFHILTPLQVAHGGPIIAFQVENEFASYVSYDDEDGRQYMQYLADLMKNLGVVELLVTSDGPDLIDASLKFAPKNALLTVNFQREPEEPLNKLADHQPEKPLMVMEYWTGWFDHWGHGHLERDLTVNEISQRISAILKLGASFNLYMFHGGTNFGFMNGANMVDGEYRPTVTSYDYSATLSEAGDITLKYTALRNVLKELASDSIPEPLPGVPPNSKKVAYGEVHVPLYLKLMQTFDYIPPPFISSTPIPMEYLQVNEGSGQAYGYVLYRTTIPSTSSKISITKLRDHGLALIDDEPVSKLSSFASQSFINNRQNKKTSKDGQSVLDILVENEGRVNYGKEMGDRKGINGVVLVDGEKPKKWKIYSFEFKPDYIEQVQAGGLWSRTPTPPSIGPTLFKGDLTISSKPEDTFLDMEGWTKGVVFINGVNLGRYWNVGPTQTLYVPAPLLKRGINKILVFELHRPKSTYTLRFIDSPILDRKHKKQS